MIRKNRNILLSVAVLSLLSGCANKSTSEQTEPLAKNEILKQRSSKNLLVNSLGSAKYFENIAKDNKE